MPGLNKAQASPRAQGEGKSIRWARNIVLRYRHRAGTVSKGVRARFERAQAVLAYDALSRK